MFKPIRQPAAGLQCTAREVPHELRKATPQPQGAWKRALLRLFAELACRLR